MKTYYHGTSKLFKEFRPLETIGTGEGKSKFGWGIYLTSSYATAVLYSSSARQCIGFHTHSQANQVNCILRETEH